MRVCSSGIVMSPERIPASTWANGTPACRAARAPASVEFVSPKTRAASGRSLSSAIRDPRKHRVDVARVRLQPVRGLGQPELLEEHVGELAVVVLSRMDDHFPDAGLAQRNRQRARLDELRPVTDD